MDARVRNELRSAAVLPEVTYTPSVNLASWAELRSNLRRDLAAAWRVGRELARRDVAAPSVTVPSIVSTTTLAPRTPAGHSQTVQASAHATRKKTLDPR